MNRKLYEFLCDDFESKSSTELRKIVAERETGDWSEESIGAATHVLEERGEEEIPEEEVPKTPGSVPEPTSGEVDVHQAMIKVLGWIYCALGVFAGFVLFTPLLSDGVGDTSLLFAFCGVVVAGVFAVIGSGLIQLDARSRGPGFVLSGIAVIFFPIGTAIGLFGIFWLAKWGRCMRGASVDQDTNRR